MNICIICALVDYNSKTKEVSTMARFGLRAGSLVYIGNVEKGKVRRCKVVSLEPGYVRVQYLSNGKYGHIPNIMVGPVYRFYVTRRRAKRWVSVYHDIIGK